jgi:hypothetical protein
VAPPIAKPSLTLRILGGLPCLFCAGRLLLVALSLRELARVVLLRTPYISRLEAALHVRDMGLKYYFRSKSRIACCRFEDYGKTTTDGVPWAADAVESR